MTKKDFVKKLESMGKFDKIVLISKLRSYKSEIPLPDIFGLREIKDLVDENSDANHLYSKLPERIKSAIKNNYQP